MTYRRLYKNWAVLVSDDQIEVVELVECVAAGSTGADPASHKVNGTESHFPEVDTIKLWNVIIFPKVQTEPNSTVDLPIVYNWLLY